MRTRILRSADELVGVRSLWEELFRGGDCTLFQSFEWNYVAAKLFAGREAVCVAVAESENGAAIIPACHRTDGTLGLLGETLFDYRGLLRAGDTEALDAAWAALAAEERELSYIAHRNGNLVPHEQTVLIDFAGAPAAVRSLGFKKKLRLERYLRALQREGGSLKRYCAPERPLVRFIYEQRGKTPGDLFADPLRREMAVSLCESAGALCEVFTLETAGTLVAALVTFRDGDWRRCYTTYFDPRWASHSPGTALLYHAITATLAEGRDCDLMTGEQPYKARLSNSRVQLYRADVSISAMRGEAQSNSQAA